MKKSILTITLVLTLLLVGTSMAFADTAPQGNGNGIQLYKTASSVEELLEMKIARIDQLVIDGGLTSEQAETYKAILKERMENCTTIGENRGNNERLSIGFGRAAGKGNFQGRGNRFGLNQE